MEVKKEITIETKGGSRILVVTPDMEKVILSRSIRCPPIFDNKSPTHCRVGPDYIGLQFRSQLKPTSALEIIKAL
jgi:hypothetical protein